MLITKPYERDRAVQYAKRWALDRNPLFADFSGIGGNCTNFVSQCVLAGSCVMNYTPDFGWYFISLDERAPAWSGVEFFYNFMTGIPSYSEQNGGIGPFAKDVPQEEAALGDAVQLQNARGQWYHTLIITGFDGETPLVSAQTNDALDRPLSSYNFSAARFLHFEGVRLEIEDDRCFEILFSGGLADGAQDASGENA